MSWNYRVIRDRNGWYVGEVYYNRHEEPTQYSSAVGMTGESRAELRAELARFQRAFELPALRVLGRELVIMADDEDEDEEEEECSTNKS